MVNMPISLDKNLEGTKVPVYAAAKEHLDWLFGSSCPVGIYTDKGLFLAVPWEMRDQLTGGLLPPKFDGLRKRALRLFREIDKICDSKKVIDKQGIKYLAAWFDYAWDRKVVIFLYYPSSEHKKPYILIPILSDDDLAGE